FKSVWADFQEGFFRSVAPSVLAVARGKRPALRGAWTERTKGASKDSDVGCLLLWLLVFARQPLLIEVGADKLDQAAETLLAMKDVRRLNPWLREFIRLQRSSIFCDQRETTCNFLTSDESGGHGSRPSVTVCNELSHVGSEAFMATMLDNASKVPNNFAIIATNAGFLRTWQWKWREQFRESERWFFHKVSEQAPWLDPVEIAEAKRRNSHARFERLWCGEWSAGEGDALDSADVEACCYDELPFKPEQLAETWPPWVFTGWLDLGVKHDHSAWVVLGVQPGSGLTWVVECRSFAPIGGRVDLGLVREFVLESYARWALDSVGYDPTQAELMAQDLEKSGCLMRPVNFGGKIMDLRANTLLSAFTRRVVRIPRDDGLIRDLHRLIIVEKRYGYKLEAVRDEMGHADRAIALSMGLPLAVAFAGEPAPEREQEEHKPERIEA
ncbi:MAG: hypothetical protein IMZ50_05960, partial [Candidatus Atribacteria bacterium]|nr:hypothetical protein [Candidatus Atribacteria bacterium]